MERLFDKYRNQHRNQFMTPEQSENLRLWHERVGSDGITLSQIDNWLLDAQLLPSKCSKCESGMIFAGFNKTRPKKIFADNMQVSTSTLRTLLYVCRLRYPHFPAYYFPVYLVVKFLKEFEFKFNTRTLNFQLVPVPNTYFDFLCRDHEIQSDHTIFINRRVFDYYIYQKDVNFINMNLSELTKRTSLSHAERVIKEVVESGKTSDATACSSLFQVFPLNNLPINKVLIKENAHWNFVEKHRLTETSEALIVNLSMLQSGQKIPGIATKCNVFLINSPYEVPNAFVDDVLREHFRKPRLLYRNHTYRIDLTESELGNFIFCENFQLITKLKRVYFKCVHLESRGSLFDTCGIVVNQLSTLNLTTTINHRSPSVKLSAHFQPSYSYGLASTFNTLRASIAPFLDDENAKFLKSRKIFPVFNVCGDRGSGKRRLVQSLADHFGLHTYFAECCELMTGMASTTEQKLLFTLHRATNCNPILLAFNDFEFFGRNAEGHEDERIVAFFRTELPKVFKCELPIIVVAISNAEVSSRIAEMFLESVKVKPLDKSDRFGCLLWEHQREVYDRLCYDIKKGKRDFDNYISWRIPEANRESDLTVLTSMAEQTTGFSAGDLRILYQRSLPPPQSKFSLEASTFQHELTRIKKCFSDSIGTPEIPRVRWEDIGGLASLKSEIQNSIGVPLKYAHLLGGRHMRRSGILLFGPPGTGKTLIAKAVATECALAFVSVQGPELLNMYVGQSEQNVRAVFAKARASAPAVIFLDELDALAPNRGVAGDSGGVMDRVVSQLLSEMDGVDEDPRKPVFVLGATNRPDLIDKQLLRPGRFDKMLYVGPCASVADKELVLNALTRKFQLKKDVSARKVAELVKVDVTGADLYSICSNAWLSAVRRQVKAFEAGKASDEQMTAERVIVGMEDFRRSMERFVSSLNQVDMEYFARLQASYA